MAGNITIKNDINGVTVKAEGISLIEAKDISAKVLTGEAGVQLLGPDGGVDAGFKANVQAVSATVGPASAHFGLSADTGVKIGEDGVGVEFLGTGMHIGRELKVSFLGSGVCIKLW